MRKAKIWEETVMIPTYMPGKPDKNPMFLDKRVYQGSSGRIYPYPTTESVSDEKKDMPWKAVFLENDYVKIEVLPQLGGRIQRAYDKTDDYDFIYYNHVIKPALVGLTGPWISGGIEFNWPQHHRPTTFQPVEYEVQENADGSVSLFTHDTDRMYGTRETTRITLYPDRSYIEIQARLYNPTPLPQTFLWWANPAVAVNDNTQSIFPPDVHAVMDHGKRDVSRFPIATGVYYKHDYSEGVDISRYKNIPVPTSYMAEKSDYDFVGGYDYGKKAGLLHVADHHISPGKKQWTWGCGDFGKAWDRNLTDSDGPYIELMTGVYTDNQPDFTWLKPYEDKTFTQYFMPYRNVGQVKNASIHAVLGTALAGDQFRVAVYSPEEIGHARVTVKKDGKPVFDREVSLSPDQTFETEIPAEGADETRFLTEVRDGSRLLTSYQARKQEITPLPEPAHEAGDPKKIPTNEELFLTGLHIEQYRHATYLPDPYYLEALRRDPGDLRVNNAYGRLLLRRGDFKGAEPYLRAAVKRAAWRNPNPYDGEPYTNLGLCLLYQGREREAYDAFYKAIWSEDQQAEGFYWLAALSSRRGDYAAALEFDERALDCRRKNSKALAMKVWLLRKLGRTEEAMDAAEEALRVNRFDFASGWELAEITGNAEDFSLLDRRMRGAEVNAAETASAFGEFGAWEEAFGVLTWFEHNHACTPMAAYAAAYCADRAGDGSAGAEQRKLAGKLPMDYCFPNRLEDILILDQAIAKNPEDARAPYLLGCLFYDKLQPEKAVELWEKSAALDPEYPTVWRNLSLAYYNRMKQPEKALEAMEKAVKLAPDDPRLFFELDQLYIRADRPAAERLAEYEKRRALIEKRDDLMIEYTSLLNQTGRFEDALAILTTRKLHPWEGGEGKAARQYEKALLSIARKKISEGDYASAETALRKALVYPENIGEGKLEGTRDNHLLYTLGIALEAQGKSAEARSVYEQACSGTDEPAGALFYNDQPADMILFQGLAYEKLGDRKAANARYYRLIDYGEQHMRDDVKIPYFAVSLPDFVVFDDDLNVKNRAHCAFLLGLGFLGLGKTDRAAEYFAEAESVNPCDARVAEYRWVLEHPETIGR